MRATQCFWASSFLRLFLSEGFLPLCFSFISGRNPATVLQALPSSEFPCCFHVVVRHIPLEQHFQNSSSYPNMQPSLRSDGLVSTLQLKAQETEVWRSGETASSLGVPYWWDPIRPPSSQANYFFFPLSFAVKRWMLRIDSFSSWLTHSFKSMSDIGATAGKRWVWFCQIDDDFFQHKFSAPFLIQIVLGF